MILLWSLEHLTMMIDRSDDIFVFGFEKIEIQVRIDMIQVQLITMKYVEQHFIIEEQIHDQIVGVRL